MLKFFYNAAIFKTVMS